MPPPTQGLRDDEWGAIERLLPLGWREAAREQGAFRRARYITDPAVLLRMLLFHGANSCGMRETVAQAHASGLCTMSSVALLKRFRTSGNWLAWISAGLCSSLREQLRLPEGLRPRILDSTSIQGPASTGTDWRLHYSLDLLSLHCDWSELTDVHGAELLERTPMQAGDVLLADRNFLRTTGVRAAVNAGAHVVVRMRWQHAPMQDADGRPFKALHHARRCRVGDVREWPVVLLDADGKPMHGRVVATRLPAPLAAQAQRRTLKDAQRRGRPADSRSVEAAALVIVFTTLPRKLMGPAQILDFYRYRWQIELAFKRHKQLLQLGRLPHQDPRAARSWILAKLVLALLLETLHRNARTLSPWGYRLATSEV